MLSKKTLEKIWPIKKFRTKFRLGIILNLEGQVLHIEETQDKDNMVGMDIQAMVMVMVMVTAMVVIMVIMVMVTAMVVVVNMAMADMDIQVMVTQQHMGISET